AVLAEVKEAGLILDEEQLAFLADPGMDEASVAQQTIPSNVAFQTEDLDAYDLDCNDLSSAKAVLMDNLSSCDSDETQDAEQAFWLKHSNNPSVTPVVSHTPVKAEAPPELPKASLVNESLKKLKYQLANFDK
nr:hypothetical protein [Tanacetum cinerariifolium]